MNYRKKKFMTFSDVLVFRVFGCQKKISDVLLLHIKYM